MPAPGVGGEKARATQSLAELTQHGVERLACSCTLKRRRKRHYKKAKFTYRNETVNDLPNKNKKYDFR